MILEKELREGKTGGGEPALDFSAGRLKVMVVFTTVEGTLSALDSAARLAQNLLAEIRLVIVEEVYFRYPLDRSPVSPTFLHRLCLALIESANLDPGEVRVEIHYCRNRMKCLQVRLRERSLVVIGAKRTGWALPERRLHTALARQGHDAILIREHSNLVEMRRRFVINSLVDSSNV
jgi:hypothetical protein